MRNPQRRSTTPSGRKCIGQSLTQGFTFGQEFVTEIGDPDFTAAVTALSAGEYGLAASRRARGVQHDSHRPAGGNHYGCGGVLSPSLSDGLIRRGPTPAVNTFAARGGQTGANAPCFRPPGGGESARGGPRGCHEQRGIASSSTHSTLNRIIAGALLTGGVAVVGIGPASATVQAKPVLTPLVWLMDDPDDPPPPPPPPPPPQPQRQCWALFIPAPCPPGQG